ncbi:MAG TPA: zinc ribbon domain-containing protein, partial [Thermoplasmata archaeon]|nr:zinc ribbon domain-containing protein [Thermoplasmata archaeon]
GPLVTSTVVFPQYRVAVAATSPTISADGAAVTNNSTAIGQNITVQELVRNVGTGTASDVLARLNLSAAGKASTQIGPVQRFGPLGPGASRLVEFNWTVNASLVGYASQGVLSTLTVHLSWDPGAGSTNASRTITIYPQYISFSTVGPSGNLVVGDSYVMHAFVGYDGNGSAILNATARSTTGGYYAIAIARDVVQGETNLNVVIEASVTPGTYSITASVYHDGRTVWHNVTNAFVVPTTVSPTPTPWYEQTFLGLALWVWLAIVAAAVAAILAFLFISVQKAKGKVVECGECGAMIPETAVACPECGAEFESDRVRCSRCGSTIPGNSAVCPECAATLLGRAGEEKDDPERQGYADFVERFRAEGKKALGDSYSESAFWDWWKRQSSYVPFGQWKMQQAQGSRSGMGAPRENVPKDDPSARRVPPTRRGPPPPPGTRAASAPATPTATTAAPSSAPPTPPPSEIPSTAGPSMITCSNCQKEIPSGYLVCPFCGAVTQ